MIYQCIECDQHYCDNCDDGGEDACPECGTGPRCNDCAVDHAPEHTEPKTNDEWPGAWEG